MKPPRRRTTIRIDAHLVEIVPVSHRLWDVDRVGVCHPDGTARRIDPTHVRDRTWGSIMLTNEGMFLVNEKVGRKFEWVGDTVSFDGALRLLFGPHPERYTAAKGGGTPTTPNAGPTGPGDVRGAAAQGKEAAMTTNEPEGTGAPTRRTP